MPRWPNYQGALGQSGGDRPARTLARLDVRSNLFGLLPLSHLLRQLLEPPGLNPFFLPLQPLKLLLPAARCLLMTDSLFPLDGPRCKQSGNDFVE